MPADRLDRYAPVLLGILRIVAGLLFLSPGLVKLFAFPAGAPPGPQPLFTLVGRTESFCGAQIALGLFTRPAAFLASGEMAVVFWMFHAPKAGTERRWLKPYRWDDASARARRPSSVVAGWNL